MVQKRQTSSLGGLSGSMVVSTTPTATALAKDAGATPISGSYTGIPLAQSTPTPSQTSSSTPSAANSSSSSSSGDISLGTVIGACVGAFILLVLVIFLAIYCSKQQKPQRRKKNARRGYWNRLDDDKSSELPMQRPPSGPMEKLGAMFHRTPSTNSGEKSSDAHGNRESVGTMHLFAKYHPGLAEEMASKSADAGITQPPPVQRFQGRAQTDSIPTTSWDSETLRADSYFSVHSDITPTAAVAKSTPPATASGSHRWESAEVGHINVDGSEISEAGDLRSHFGDSAASIRSGLNRRVTNPFFNAQEKSQKRTPLVSTTPANPFADSNAVVTEPFLDAHSETTGGGSSSSNNTQAMQSLIAALNMQPEERLRAMSLQSSRYSSNSTIMSDCVSVTAFPYPPTEVLHPQN